MRNICRIVLAITTAGMLAAAPSSALSQPAPPASVPCADLDVIFARGSGGKLNSVEKAYGSKPRLRRGPRQRASPRTFTSSVPGLINSTPTLRFP